MYHAKAGVQARLDSRDPIGFHKSPWTPTEAACWLTQTIHKGSGSPWRHLVCPVPIRRPPEVSQALQVYERSLQVFDRYGDLESLLEALHRLWQTLKKNLCQGPGYVCDKCINAAWPLPKKPREEMCWVIGYLHNTVHEISGPAIWNFKFENANAGSLGSRIADWAIPCKH